MCYLSAIISNASSVPRLLWASSVLHSAFLDAAHVVLAQYRTPHRRQGAYASSVSHSVNSVSVPHSAYPISVPDSAYQTSRRIPYLSTGLHTLVA
eukprot:512015-Rhodomonas_salina.1